MIHSHEGDIHQPHLPHHLASGVIPPWFKQLFINNLNHLHYGQSVKIP
nr:MAG TPA: hypothetical protein [Crassvirales sp.]